MGRQSKRFLLQDINRMLLDLGEMPMGDQFQWWHTLKNTHRELTERYKATMSNMLTQIRINYTEVKREVPRHIENLKMPALREYLNLSNEFRNEIQAIGYAHNLTVLGYINGQARTFDISYQSDTSDTIPDREVPALMTEIDRYANQATDLTIVNDNVTPITPININEYATLPMRESYALSYNSLTHKPIVETKDMCVFDILREDFNIDDKTADFAIRACTEIYDPSTLRKIGVTADQFISILGYCKIQNRVVLKDFLHNTIARYNGTSNHFETKCYLSGNSHLYMVTPEYRKSLLSSRSSEITPFDSHFEAPTIPKFMPKAIDMVYCDNITDAIRSPHKTIIVKLDEGEAAKQYLDHIAEHRIVYKSDVSRSSISHIEIQTGDVKRSIFINKDFDAITEVCEIFNIRYQNQKASNIATMIFDQYHKGADISTPNRELLRVLSESPKPLIFSQSYNEAQRLARVGITLKTCDLYRSYTTVLNNGGFYKVDRTHGFVDGFIPTAHAYIVTPQFEYYNGFTPKMLFQGNGVYDYQVVHYALDIRIISTDDITHSLVAMPASKFDNHAKLFISDIYNKVPNDLTRKMMVNSFIGTLAIHTRKVKPTRFILSDHQQACAIVNTIPKAKFETHGYGPNALYMISHRYEVERNHNFLLINRAIIQRGRMNLIRMIATIQSIAPSPMVVHHVNTDSVTFITNNDLNIPNINTHQFGTIRTSTNPHVKQICDVPRIEHMREFKTPYIGPDMNDKPTIPKFSTTVIKPQTSLNGISVDNKSSDEIASKLYDLKRCLITGSAGSGKTHVSKALIKVYESNNKKVRTTGFTHNSIDLYDNDRNTLHASLGRRFDGSIDTSKLSTLYEGYDAIIVDEGSMIDQIFYDLLSILPVDIDLYMFGDFRQHTPITNKLDPRSIMTNPVVIALFKYHIQLNTQHRSDGDYIMLCNNYADRLANFDNQKSTNTYEETNQEIIDLITNKLSDNQAPQQAICYTNKCRMKVTDQMLSNIPQAVRIPKAERVLIKSHVEFFNPTQLIKLIKCQQDVNIIKDYNDMLYTSVITSPTEAYRYVTYKASTKCPREYVNGIGLQRMKKAHMSYITRGLYDEYDISNCCYNIILSLAKQYKVNHSYIGFYTKHRDQILNMLVSRGLSRDEAKAYLISFIYGRKAYHPPQPYNDMGPHHYELPIQVIDNVDVSTAAVKHTLTFKQVSVSLSRFLHGLHTEISKTKQLVVKLYKAPPQQFNVIPPQSIRPDILTSMTPEDVDKTINKRFTDILFFIESDILRTVEHYLYTTPYKNNVPYIRSSEASPRDRHQSAHSCIKKFDAILIRANAIINPADKHSLSAKLSAHVLKRCNIDVVFKLTQAAEMFKNITEASTQVVEDIDIDKYQSTLDYTDHFDQLSHIYTGMELIATRNDNINNIPIHNMSRWTLGRLVPQEDLVDTKTGMRTHLPDLREVVSTKDGESVLIDQTRVGLIFDSPICLTTYRAQGMSINKPLRIYEFHKLDRFGRYVAMTRTTDKKLLSFDKINRRKLGLPLE